MSEQFIYVVGNGYDDIRLITTDDNYVMDLIESDTKQPWGLDYTLEIWRNNLHICSLSFGERGGIIEHDLKVFYDNNINSKRIEEYLKLIKRNKDIKLAESQKKKEEAQKKRDLAQLKRLKEKYES